MSRPGAGQGTRPPLSLNGFLRDRLPPGGDLAEVFDPARREARRARLETQRKRFACRDNRRMRRFGRKRWPRRSRVFGHRCYGRSTDRAFPPRSFRPRTFINACRTGWPGGYSYQPRGATLPADVVRTSFVDGKATNRRCHPGFGGGDVRTGTGGTLLGSIALARSEAQRQADEDAARRLLEAGRASGSSVDATNAFALRYAEDLCTPWFCRFDGPSWNESQNRGTVKGRADAERFAKRGDTLIPLDVAGLEAKLGRRSTEGERISACASEEFLIRGKRRGSRTGRWASVPLARAAAALAPAAIAARARLVLAGALGADAAAPVLSGSGPFTPGQQVYACRRLTPGGTYQGYAGPYTPGMEGYWTGFQGGVTANPADLLIICPQVSERQR